MVISVKSQNHISPSRQTIKKYFYAILIMKKDTKYTDAATPHEKIKAKFWALVESTFNLGCQKTKKLKAIHPPLNWFICTEYPVCIPDSFCIKEAAEPALYIQVVVQCLCLSAVTFRNTAAGLTKNSEHEIKETFTLKKLLQVCFQ